MCLLLEEGIGFPFMGMEGAPRFKGNVIMHKNGEWSFEVYHTSPRVAEKYYIFDGRVECEYLGECEG